MRIVGFLCLLLVHFSACEQPKSYEGFTVHKVVPKKESQVDALKTLQNENSHVNFWTQATQPEKPTYIMVGPHERHLLESFLHKNGIENHIVIKDVQKLIQRRIIKTRSTPKPFDFKDFHRLAVIYDYLEDLAHLYPQNVKIIQGGHSYEGRSIKGVHVSFSQSNQNRAVFLEGGLHAREWISPTTVIFLLSQILTSNDQRVLEMAQNYDWYIFPVLNPDGYEYSHTNDRMWRKTRKPNEKCIGTDLNRNWGHHWGSKGPNSQECSLTYSGEHAFSEVEARSMSEFIGNIGNKLYAYFSFHSFGQFILIPYGYTFHQVDNYKELKRISEKAIESLYQRYQTEYLFGTLAESTSFANGSSIDWVRGTFGTRFVFLYELRDDGHNGFLLPPEDIIPTGEETLDSLVTLLDEASKL